MKILSQSLLMLAIAASPLAAVQAFESLDDSEMSAATGQANTTSRPVYVDRIVEEGINIQKITYTDIDGLGESNDPEKIKGGSLVIDAGSQDYAITVTGKEWEWDDDTKTTGKWVPGKTITTQKIWLDENGNMRTYTVANDKAHNGMVGPIRQRKYNGTTQNVSAMEITIGRVLLKSQAQKEGKSKGGANLVSNLSLVQESGDSNAHIVNLARIKETNGFYHYQYDANLDDAKIPQASRGGIAIVSDSYSRIEKLEVDALDGAVQILGLKHGGGENGDELNRSTMLIYVSEKVKDDRKINVVHIESIDNGGLTTTSVDELRIGGASLGKVVLGNVNQSGTTMRIYSH